MTDKKRNLNINLHQAKSSKKDEFYTQLEDIEQELQHYWQHFKGKVVYCNCGDPSISKFFGSSDNFRDAKRTSMVTFEPRILRQNSQVLWFTTRVGLTTAS